ncbi:hypothetical protein [Frigoriflavimonas asaccharolytica]|uniref:Uncharacterized protein n=1 Tax=Frigoriflavimonas asaccharolytica TaxID=2735899 RepID=A0A8J8K7Z7_9FLAO|nr:hypothetical protein [Frigoriflavimonas asaccharolytica]NRS92523.1 hypothetical protein [Frigoriflavimonas asaccharolytica]
MKKLLILSIPILLFSCKKDAEIREDPNVFDSMMVKAPENKIDSSAIKDSMKIDSKIPKEEVEVKK